MDKYITAVTALSKSPKILYAIILAGLAYAFISNVLPQIIAKGIKDNAGKASDLKTIALLRAEISALNAQEVSDIAQLAQGVVDKEPNPSWFTYFDRQSNAFRILVLNRSYAEDYGIEFPTKDKTGIEAYTNSRPDLSDDELKLILTYEINDRKAVAARGDCIVFNEWSLKVGEERKIRRFQKCAMYSGTITLVYGEELP